jgi:ATP-binding cassette subfamily G (WHITE) protein 2 (SNQ2)
MLRIYFMIFLSSAVVNVILSRYSAQIRPWNARERFSRSYSWVALVTAKVLVELPGALVSTVVYFLPWYFPSGLPLSEAGYIFLNFLTYEIYQVRSRMPFTHSSTNTEYFQVLLGLFMMGISPSLAFAGNVLVFVVSVCDRFNGTLVPWDEIQVFWQYWV